ncbi:hypothetical protein JXA84_05785 [candidate division WOR-3 bacterium]|nr:hypothetical protein [candidate division WOR-3 bacterium]
MTVIFFILLSFTDFERHLIVREMAISVETNEVFSADRCFFFKPFSQTENDTLASASMNLAQRKTSNDSVYEEETLFVSVEKLNLSWELLNPTLFTPENARWKMDFLLSYLDEGALFGFHEDIITGTVQTSALSQEDLAPGTLTAPDNFLKTNLLELAAVSFLCAGLVFAFYFIR